MTLKEKISEYMQDHIDTYSGEDVDALVKIVENWTSEMINLCPSCSNNEADNPNNWCAEYAEQMRIKERIEVYID